VGDPNVEILIVDANVLIDFCQTDPSVLALVVRHVAVVNVAEPVLDEVDQLDRMAAEALGIRVVTPDFACFTRAAQLAQRSPLQFQDWLCLLLAEAQGWICVTNDKRLRAECQQREVATLWGLELLLRLVEQGALPADSAVDIAEAIHGTNRRVPRKVIDAFIRQVMKM
jgi:predicted nucleic acid-binding protein